MRLIIRSPWTSSTREEAKPPINASRTFAGSAPALAASTSASPTASMFNATMIWFVAGLPVAVAADECDVLAHHLKKRPNALEDLRLSANHDGERACLRADLAARHRCVEVSAGVFLLDAAGELLCRQRRNGTHVHYDLARCEAGGYPICAE